MPAALYTQESKTCTGCKVQLPMSAFTLRRDRARGYEARCRPCNAAANRARYQNDPEVQRRVKETSAAWAKANPDRVRANQIKHKYGLSPDKYATLVADGCAICGRRDDLVVDHDHACCSGQRSCGQCIRGALCRECNLILGHAKDDPELLARAIRYLGGASSVES